MLYRQEPCQNQHSCCHFQHLCVWSFFFLLTFILSLFLLVAFAHLYQRLYLDQFVNISIFCTQQHSLLFTRSQFLCDIADGQAQLCPFDFGEQNKKDQLREYHLGACQKCRVLDLIPDLLNPHLLFTRIPKDTYI